MRNALILAFVVMLVFFAEVVGGIVEGHFFPVTSRAEIREVAAAGQGLTRIWGEIRKRRDCAFVEVEWWLGVSGRRAAGAYAVADLEFEEGTRVRASGPFSFGPWRLQLTPEQVLNRSHAIVFHRCHAFWLTETLLYDSRDTAG